MHRLRQKQIKKASGYFIAIIAIRLSAIKEWNII
jgi:hypothetical protein